MASLLSSRWDSSCDTAATASIGTPPVASPGRSTTTRTMPAPPRGLHRDALQHESRRVGGLPRQAAHRVDGRHLALLTLRPTCADTGASGWSAYRARPATPRGALRLEPVPTVPSSRGEPRRHPPRRTVLAVGILAGRTLVTALAGCTSAAPVPAAPVTTPPDVARATRRRRAGARASRALAAQAAALRPYAAAARRPCSPPWRRTTPSILSALGETVRTPTPSPDAPAAARPVSPSVAVAAELAAAQTALDDAQTAGGGLAVLLTRIAAARAVHADLLASQTGQSAPAPAGRHAPGGVRGIGDAVPHRHPHRNPHRHPQPLALGGGHTHARGGRRHARRRPGRARRARRRGTRRGLRLRRDHRPHRPRGTGRRAQAAWASHVRHRDELEERLQDAGVEAPVAAPAYDLGAQAQDPAGLAAAVEDGLATLAARAVAAGHRRGPPRRGGQPRRRCSRRGGLAGPARRPCPADGRSPSVQDVVAEPHDQRGDHHEEDDADEAAAPRGSRCARRASRPPRCRRPSADRAATAARPAG